MKHTSIWEPPSNWLRITTTDAHTAGEPLRVITSGFPQLPGKTILDKRRYALQNLDHLRTALMWEPRGHADMYGCIITEPETADGTLGVLFLHNEGYSTMCGHGIIGLTKVVIDTGLIQVDANEPVIRMDTPAGRVTAFARIEDGNVSEVSFHNVPSFVYCLDQELDVPGVGQVRFDIAFGGAFYAFCQAKELGLNLIPEDFRKLIDVGMSIKRTVMENIPTEHPFEEDLSFLYGTIFVGEAYQPGHHSRNVCIFADGEVDRCPTGTGVSARAAIHNARGELDVHEPFIVESILGTCFKGEIVATTKYGNYDAIIPKVTGSAHIIARNEWLIDPQDPLRDGFTLR
jgi:proline racemase